MIFMARSTKSYEERMLQLEKKEQESLEIIVWDWNLNI